MAYTTLDVFTAHKYAGNPLAVVELPASVTLSQEQKQIIAREFNYSETVFLHVPDDDDDDATSKPSSQGQGQGQGEAQGNSPKADADADDMPEWRLDIFTTEEELPFAGHPTIGSAYHVLAARGLAQGRFRIKAGVLRLRYDAHTQQARAGIPHDIHVHTSHPFDQTKLLAWQAELAAHLFQAASLAETPGPGRTPLRIDVVSPVRGMNFAMVALPDLAALAAVKTTGSRLPGVALDAGWEAGPLFAMFYVRQGGDGGDGGDGSQVVALRTRMIEGVFEDPATGSASCALAALIALTEKREGRTVFEMVQGVEMGRESRIGVEIVVQDGAVRDVELIGTAVPVMQGRVFYE